MRRSDAKQIVDEGRVTFAGLRHAIAMSRRDGMSKVNASLTKAQSLDILWKAIENRDGAECVRPYTLDVYTGRHDRRTGDGLTAINIIRECGWVTGDARP